MLSSTFWDLSDRLTLVSILVSGCLLVSSRNLYLPAGILSWISTTLALRNVFWCAPTFRLSIHWRAIGLYSISLAASVTLAVTASKTRNHQDDLDLTGLGAVMIVVSLISVPLYVLFPRPSGTPVLGPYKKIGTASFVLELDPSYKDRPENEKVLFDKYNSVLPVQIWFPMAPKSNSFLDLCETWLTQRSLLWTSGCPDSQFLESNILLQNIAKNYHLPVSITGHLSLARTNSFWQDDLRRVLEDSKASRFPIAIYSHGMYGWRQLHTSLCESLASLGFIVLACDHAPDCMISRPVNRPPSEYVPFDFNVPEELAGGMKERKFYTSGFQRRVRDIQSLLDHITDGGLEQRYPSLKNRLQLNHICLWGHSFGGGTVMSVACKDSRITRVATLDGWMYPMPDELRKRGVQTACILNLTSHLWQYGPYQVLFRREVTAKNPAAGHKFDLIFKGTDHQNYCQTHFIAHKALLRRSKVIGPDLDPHFVISVLEYLVASFFMVPKTNDGQILSDVDNVPNKPLSSTTDAGSSDRLVEIPIVERLLKFIDHPSTVTGTSVSLPQVVKDAVLQHVVHEQEVTGFANPDFYHRVEEYLKSQENTLATE